MIAVRQGTEEWLEARRQYITSTDLPVILGLSPYKVEADLAREKAGERDEIPPDRERMMRLGESLETVIRDEDQLEHGIRIRRVNRFIVSPTIPWAATSLDFERIGERCIVEAKASRSRRWDDGLPQDVEAQVRWQMGVAGYPRAHVAVLRSGTSLDCYDVEHDRLTWDYLVGEADGFRTRLAAGGPFAESNDSLKRRYPADNGAEMVADPDIAEAVRALVALRERRRAMEEDEGRLEAAVKTRMADAAVLTGPGFHVIWRRTKDREETDWKTVAAGVLHTLSETERAALVGLYTTVRPGFRPFRVVLEKED